MSETQQEKKPPAVQLPADEAPEDEVRVVKHALFSYYVDAPHPFMEGQTQPVTRHAFRGDVVHIPREYDRKLGDYHGAFYTEDELKMAEAVLNAPATDETGARTLDDMTPEEIARYIVDNRANAQMTIQLAQGNPEWAKKVVEAEGIAMQGEPRQTVLQGLARIVGDPGAQEPPPAS